MYATRFLRAATVMALASAMTSQSAANTVSLTGVFNVKLTIMSDNGAVPLNTSLNVNISISAFQTSGGQRVQATETVTKTSTSQVVSISVPYDWTLVNPLGTVMISVSVTPALTYPAADSASVSGSVPLPANNATTNVSAPIQL